MLYVPCYILGNRLCFDSLDDLHKWLKPLRRTAMRAAKFKKKRCSTKAQPDLDARLPQSAQDNARSIEKQSLVVSSFPDDVIVDQGDE